MQKNRGATPREGGAFNHKKRSILVAGGRFSHKIFFSPSKTFYVAFFQEKIVV